MQYVSGLGPRTREVVTESVGGFAHGGVFVLN
jgi:hypothetical protein